MTNVSAVRPTMAPAPFTPPQAHATQSLAGYGRSSLEAASEAGSVSASTSVPVDPAITMLQAIADTTDAAVATDLLSDLKLHHKDAYDRLTTLMYQNGELAPVEYEDAAELLLIGDSLHALVKDNAKNVVAERQTRAPIVDVQTTISVRETEAPVAPQAARDTEVASSPASRAEAPKGFFATFCDNISSFFTSVIDWVKSLFSTATEESAVVESAPATAPSPRSGASSAAPVAEETSVVARHEIYAFHGIMNGVGVDRDVMLAAYNALSQETKNLIEGKVYQLAVETRPELNPNDAVHENQFGSRYVQLNMGDDLVKEAIAAVIETLEAPVAVETVEEAEPVAEPELVAPAPAPLEEVRRVEVIATAITAAVETPVAVTPVAVTPVAETPVAETPAAETPAAETTAAETTAA